MEQITTIAEMNKELIGLIKRVPLTREGYAMRRTLAVTITELKGIKEKLNGSK